MVAYMSTLIVLLGLIGLISVISLVVQSAMEDPRIIAVGVGGWIITYLFERFGTMVMVVLGSITALGVFILMVPILIKHIRELRFWLPLTGLLFTIAVVTLMSIR
jgi:hypothetical protein